MTLGATTLISLSVIFDKLAYRSSKFEIILNGKPIILIKDGQYCRENLEKEEISEIELQEALRMNGVKQVQEVEYAMLESNGKISFIVK